MNSMSLKYELPNSLGVLHIDAAVVAHFMKHRQKKFWTKEAGGQLFANVDLGEVRIIEATGPRKTDRRSAYGYVPDRNAEQQEIRVQYWKGLHFVGDWHTHRERIPTPSSTDLQSMKDMVTQSSHSVFGFFLIVVGQDDPPAGLHVSLQMPQRNIVLHPSV